MSVTIYHSPYCSKSRATLALLKEKEITPSMRLYLEDTPTAEELAGMLLMLGMSSTHKLMRKSEDAYKEGDLDDHLLTAEDLIAAMIVTPKLIKRPIVVCQGRARIGRPPEQVLEIL